MSATSLKKLDLNQRAFEANGNKYTILESIPLSRYKQFQKLSVKLAYGMSIQEIIKNCVKGFQLLNQPKPEPVAAGIILHNIANGARDIEDEGRHDPALMICALIIVREGEDIGVYDEQLCIDKVNDWAKEGYEPNGFFHLALVSSGVFKGILGEYILKNNQ